MALLLLLLSIKFQKYHFLSSVQLFQFQLFISWLVYDYVFFVHSELL